MFCLWEEHRGHLMLEAAQTVLLPSHIDLLLLPAGTDWHISFDYWLPSHGVENWNSLSQGSAMAWGVLEQLCGQ